MAQDRGEWNGKERGLSSGRRQTVGGDDVYSFEIRTHLPLVEPKIKSKTTSDSNPFAFRHVTSWCPADQMWGACFHFHEIHDRW